MPTRIRPSLDWLLILVPLSIVLEIAGGNELLIFLTSAGSDPSARRTDRPLDRAARDPHRSTDRRSGERDLRQRYRLVICVFLILEDEVDIVKASLTGSDPGEPAARPRPVVPVRRAASTRSRATTPDRPRSTRPRWCWPSWRCSCPRCSHSRSPRRLRFEREVVSGTVAAVLIGLYVAALVFTLVTHEHLFRTPAPEEHPSWSRRKAIGLLLASTAVVALEAGVPGELARAGAGDLGLSELFVGLIVIPSSATRPSIPRRLVRAPEQGRRDARDRDRILDADRVVRRAGARVHQPAVGHPMDFVFSTFEVAAVGAVHRCS